MKISRIIAGVSLMCLASAGLPVQTDIAPKPMLAAAAGEALITENTVPPEDASVDETRTLSERYPNFIVYEVEGHSASEAHAGYDIESERSGERVLYLPPAQDAVYGIYPMEDGSLLCSKRVQNRFSAVYWRLYPDGTKTEEEKPFVVSMRDERGRFIVMRHKKAGADEASGSVKESDLRYGMLDADFETELLPVEYSVPRRDDLKANDGVPAHFDDGYMILGKYGKFGILDDHLQVKIPFAYDNLNLRKNQIYTYEKGEDVGVLFLETGAACGNAVVSDETAALVTADTLDGKHDRLIDRTGTVLFTAPEGAYIRFDESGRPLLNNEPLETAELTAVSPWAEADIQAAREAGLLPRELCQRFQYPVTRREFCMLALQLVRARRPALAAGLPVESAALSYDSSQNVFWDYTRHDLDWGVVTANAAAKLGIIAGRADGSFDPFSSITRQDAAVILANTAALLDVEAGGGAPDFADAADAAEYAWDAIQTVGSIQTPDGERLMGGDGGKFQPRQPYTVEQAVATMYRLYTAAE